MTEDKKDENIISSEENEENVENCFPHVLSKKMENFASINSRGFAYAFIINLIYSLRFGNDSEMPGIDFIKILISLLAHGTSAPQGPASQGFRSTAGHRIEHAHIYYVYTFRKKRLGCDLVRFE